MNNDLISREALKKELHNFFDGKVIDEPDYILRDVFCHIDNAPTFDLTEDFLCEYLTGYDDGMNKRPQGEWIKWNFRTVGPLGDWDYKCSNCEKVYYGEYNYCPNCGARMGGTT